MSDSSSTYNWPLIGGGILVGAVVVTYVLGVFAPAPEKGEPPPQAPLVSATTVETRAGSLLVRGTGTVRPARQIQLTAQVGGRIVDVSDALVSGGRFEAGETLARIDPSDYRNAVRQAEAQVTQAQFRVIQAREEVSVAKRDYERVRERTGRAPEPDSTELGRLVYNEPQLAQAEANLESARAALENARTNLARTRLDVPFDGMVRQKQIDLGGVVAPGTPVATVYSTETVEVVVSLPSRKAALIRNLWANGAQGTAGRLPATVTLTYGGRDFSWDGRVHRVEGAIDEQTRTVDVVVRVPRPYEQAIQVQSQLPEQPYRPERPPLAVGSYVTVDIEGQRGSRYQVVPRRAVHDRTPGRPPTVWTLAGDSMLVEQEVEPIQTVENRTFLAPTLPDDARVITTDLRVHTDSMRVRLAEAPR
jgi:RND family efflux transporter MFP subunit